MQGVSQFKRLFSYNRFFSCTISDELWKEVSPSIISYTNIIRLPLSCNYISTIHLNGHGDKREFDTQWLSGAGKKSATLRLVFYEATLLLIYSQKTRRISSSFHCKTAVCRKYIPLHMASPSSEVANRVNVLRRINTFFLFIFKKP